MNRRNYSYDNLAKDFAKRETELRRAYRNKDYVQTLSYLRFLSHLYWESNYKMTSDTVEEITAKTAYQILGDTTIENADKHRVCFYDFFGLYDRGLAMIYLHALIGLGYYVDYIIYEFVPMQYKFQEIFGNNQSVCCKVIPRCGIVDRMRILQKYLKESSASSFFFYSVPDDVAGAGFFSTIKGKCLRYLIDLTDHAYWLGKCAADYIVGFRNYGYNIALQYRKIDSEKLLILPFYPDSREMYAFEGLPFDDRKRRFVFSGGSIYKIDGATNNLYEEIVRHILDQDSNMCFVYAGNGKSEILDRIKQGYPDRFYQIDERKDLDALLQRAYIYLSTYPLGGGVLTQFACKNGCIPITFCDEPNGITDPKTYLINPDKVHFSFYRKEDLFSEIDKLIHDNQYYDEAKKNLKDLVITEEEFQEQLQCILLRQRTKYQGIYESLNMTKFLDIYKKRFDYDRYSETICKSRNKYLYKHYPLIFFKGVIKKWEGERKQSKLGE
ncbi:MAG: hypothetical protein HFI54_14220 [Lachnospiraceae bacterium]|nr:hypothetical protein [Lachnospiraceae bacterium]